MCSFLGEFQSKLQSFCNVQPWLQVPALHPAKVKFPSSQGIYLDQVLADSSKPLSSSKRTLLTLHQPSIHQQLPRISSCNLIHTVKLPRSHLKPSLKKLTATLDYHRLGSGLAALPDSTSFFIKFTSIHSKTKIKIVFHLFPKHKLRLLTSCVSPAQSPVPVPVFSF
ncbi:hypothetical protein ILYODFUR_036001 [Ilyodon furcidens]|uniref:Uncharacterized protein n=1 Tax=Ilyodon furcidens TaxID=33524 RepID=A0ABV0UY89_9TELE